MTRPDPQEGSLSSRVARLLLGGIMVVVAIEWATSAFVYRARISTDDLEAVATAIPDGASAALAPQWLGPRARMAIPEFRSIGDAVGRPDLRGVDDLWVLDLAHGDGWSPDLERELEEGVPFVSLEHERFGGLSLHHLTRDAGAVLVSSAVGSTPEVHAERLDREEPRTQCRRAGSTYTCKRSARVRVRLAEIDYQPRYCVVVDLDERHVLTLRYEDFAFGNVARGHVGFGDFNARLRSDAPVDVAVRVDDETQFHGIFSDDQGWAPFAFTTEPGRRTLEVELRVATRGTWQGKGYDAGHAHPVCIELRSFEEGGA